MRKSLALMAALAMAESMVSYGDPRERGSYDQKPINTGRRAEKDAEALRKAQAKRDRKSAKRMAAA